jgi:hypothetical protein
MTKKTHLRQTQIITLGDYNQQQIHDINRDKENMIKEYQQKKEGKYSVTEYSKTILIELRLQLIRKQQLLDQAKHDLEAMNKYKVLNLI